MHTELRTLLRQTSALTSITAIGVLLAQPVLANPLGGDVVSGFATISSPDPSTTLINQSTDGAVINWDSFNIGVGELTQFDLPNSDSWTLNRVVGSQSPSVIQGSIVSNGNIVIVNPDGMHFGPGSTVDVNRLIASSADITNDNFMAGQLDFGIAGNPSASIVNEGVISAADYGLAALVAPSVRNSGVIMARLGTVSLASGNSFTIDPYGDGLIKLAVGDQIASDVFDIATGDAVSDLVSNDGTLSADGGTVAMTAATARQAVNSVVNNTGIVEARSVGMQNGMIVLGGGTSANKPANAPVQAVRVSGTIDASGSDELYPLGTAVTGGEIEVTGEAIIMSGATIDASGTNGGGTVLVGGDYLGGNIDAQEALALGVALENRAIGTATLVVLDDDTLITADAVQDGNGGKIIVWSDGVTSTGAEIMARGGALAGDGGFIETSGSYLDLRRSADASAVNGLVGTWLIDPADLTIETTFNGDSDAEEQTLFLPNDLQDLTDVSSFPGTRFGGSSLEASVIEDALNSGTSVSVSTVGNLGSGNSDIILAADINKTSGGEALLELVAAGDIQIENGTDIWSTSDRLWVTLDASGGAISASNLGAIDLNGGGIALIAQDNILMSSNSDMPNLAIEVLPDGGGARAVAIEFDDDGVAFGFNDETVIIPTGGISLTDATADGTLAIDVDGLDLNMDIVLSNLSLVDRFGRFRFIENDDGSIGVLESDALDGTPEIIFGVDQYDLFGQSSDGQNYLYTAGPEPDSGIIPVAEISTDFNESVDVYEVGAPSGIAIIEAYLADLNPPVEPPAPPEAEPTEPEQIILNPDVFIGPIEPTPMDRILVSDREALFPLPDFTTAGSTPPLSDFEEQLLSVDSREAALALLSQFNDYTGYLEMAKTTLELYRKGYSPEAITTYILSKDMIVSSLGGFGFESNVAESVASTVSLGMGVAAGGGVLSAGLYALEQSELILEASIELRSANTQAVSKTTTTVESTLSAFQSGQIDEEMAISILEASENISRDLASSAFWSDSRDSANRMWITSQLAIMKIEEGPETLPARSLLRTGDVKEAISRMDANAALPGQLNNSPYSDLADQLARDFGLRTW